jgi:N-methylhydantoinase A
MAVLVAVDIGGTFTDFVLLTVETGEVRTFKVPSTPPDFARGFATGFQDLAQHGGAAPEQVSSVFHGTTVGTNALIERRLPILGLLTTQGMRDVLEIRRHWRGPGDLYNFFLTVPEPLVPRDRRKEVTERLAPDGTIVTALVEADVRSALMDLREAGVESLAVCFLHAYANAAHERRVRELLDEVWPGTPLSLSHEVCGELREYERTSTTVVNSALLPIMRAYLRTIGGELRSMGVAGSLHIMQSNGGLMTPEVVADRPVTTVLSGPVGGVMGGIFVGQQRSERALITLDMGGTSCDICLVEDGKPRMTTEKELAGSPVRVPMFDIVTIGAGGGSIAWIDPGGSLQVGPRSAGARPGPACFGLGGIEPTITDAQVVLGRIHPASSLGGTVRVDAALADRAVRTVAERLAMTTQEAALGILRIANAKMVESIKVVSVRKGYDPRDFSLVVGGGAGPLHGIFLADELQMRQVIIPLSPGTLSAFGLLASDVKYDVVRSYVRSLGDTDLAVLNRALEELSAAGVERVRTSRIPLQAVNVAASLDLRYLGQAYELSVPAPERPVDAARLADLATQFHQTHERLYGYAMPGEEVELVNIRVQVIGALPAPRFRPIRRGSATPSIGAMIAHRDVAWEDGRRTRTTIYARGALESGNRLRGPCIVEQSDCTVAIPDAYEVEVDTYGNLIGRRR